MELKDLRGHVPLRVLARMSGTTESYVSSVENGLAAPNGRLSAAYAEMLLRRRSFTFVADALADAASVGARAAYERLREDVEWAGFPRLLRDVRGTTSYSEVCAACECSQAVVYSFEGDARVRISEKLLHKLLTKYAAMEASGNTLTYDRSAI